MSNAESNARAWLETIYEQLSALNEAQESGDSRAEDEAREAIDEGPLSVDVRSGWHSPGSPMEAVEYQVLLSTGGPALRIWGELDRYGAPASAKLQYQDWGTPWTEFLPDDVDAIERADATLLRYAGCFYFGEG